MSAHRRVPAWTSGQSWYPGGPFYCGGINHGSNNNNRSHFQGYAEGDQPGAWSDSSSAYAAPGFAPFAYGVGASLYVEKGVVASLTKIGLRGYTGIGTIWNVLAGDGVSMMRMFGNTVNDDPAWTEYCDANQRISYKFNYADNTSPMNMNGAAHSRPFSMEFPHGAFTRNVFQDSGTAPPSTGSWPAGAIRWNENTASGQPEKWRCTVAGTPGTWVAVGVMP